MGNMEACKLCYSILLFYLSAVHYTSTPDAADFLTGCDVCVLILTFLSYIFVFVVLSDQYVVPRYRFFVCDIISQVSVCELYSKWH